MRLCSIEGCGKKHVAKGYCKSHYEVFCPRGTRSLRQSHGEHCSVDGCNLPYYGKGFCETHWRWERYGYPKLTHKICSAPGCSKTILSTSVYCPKHKAKLAHGYPLDVNGTTVALKGSNNPNWNGGIADYPNHYTLKKNRISKLESVGWQCQRHGPGCKGRATQTHHIDGNKSNHSLNNLMPLCSTCHGTIRKEEKVVSSDIRLFGIGKGTLRALVQGSTRENLIDRRIEQIDPQLRGVISFLVANQLFSDEGLSHIDTTEEA